MLCDPIWSLAWGALCEIHFFTGDHRVRTIDETREVKNVDVVQVLVFAMAAAKRDDSVLRDGRRCVEPLCVEALHVEIGELGPLFEL